MEGVLAMRQKMEQGSVAEFKANWERPEAEYCHFTRGEPKNQIQFAFRQNWLEFARIMEPLKPWDGRKALEVGAGRGTMSMYFADAGFDCTLLDACEKPLEQAKLQFERHGLKCETHVGDAMQLPFEDESFDVVFSYGLMEHFENIFPPILEQARVLRSGGLLVSYVVPDNENERCDFRWAKYLNAISFGRSNKQEVYRNRLGPTVYEVAFAGFCGREVNRVFSTGVYNAPILGGLGFPFTLNDHATEERLVECMKSDVERFGWDGPPSQAFIVWGWKR